MKPASIIKVISTIFALCVPVLSFAEEPPTLEALFSGKLKTVDLSYKLNSTSPYWPGENYQPFELKTIATLENDGVLSKVITLPEHLGTHIDAPNHFENNQPDVSSLTPEELWGPGVLIDITVQAEQNADYMLSLNDVLTWEKAHGAIPQGAIVLLNTGWGRFWTNYDRYKNQDVKGTLHFPGFSPEAAEYLLTKRNIRGIGLDTLSIDRGISTDFKVHHLINGAGKFGLENLAKLSQLPPRGFYLIIAPIKVENGTGGPTRVHAILPNGS